MVIQLYYFNFIHKIDIVHYEAKFKPGWPMLYNLQLDIYAHMQYPDTGIIDTQWRACTVS